MHTHTHPNHLSQLILYELYVYMLWVVFCVVLYS